MSSRICSSELEVDELYARLKMTPCPHCQKVGSLIRHGFLRGYDTNHQRSKTVRAARVFCSNRNRVTGCGRTFSVWLAHKIKRFFLGADSLWQFLSKAVSSGNKLSAFRNLNSGLSDSAPYHVWRSLDCASHPRLNRTAPPSSRWHILDKPSKSIRFRQSPPSGPLCNPSSSESMLAECQRLQQATSLS